MHISREIFKGMVDKKSILKLLILEFLKGKNNGKTVLEIRNFLLEEVENNVLTHDKGHDGKSVRNYLEELEENNLTRCFQEKNKPDRWALDKNISHQEAIVVNEESVAKLRGLRNMLERYNYFPFIFDLNGWIEANQSHLDNIEERHGTGNAIVGFDAIQEFHGQENIATLYDSIDDQTLISFKYESFPKGDDRNSITKDHLNFRPHMLKEHGNRWYLVGNFKPGGNFICFGVDRITEWIDAEEPKFNRDIFNPDKIWKHSMGIYTSSEDGNGKMSSEPEAISFKVKNGTRYNNIKYLETDPIHPSQEPKVITSDMYDDDGYVKFSLNVFLDTDLVRKLRSIGTQNIKDISNEALDNWVRGE